MRVSVYSTAWSVVSKQFDFKGALDNWATFADEISLAIPLCDEDESIGPIQTYAKDRGYPVSIVRPDSDFKNDPFAYGKTENAALQNCTGDLLVQQNLDERMRVSRNRLEELHRTLEGRFDVSAFWVPTIDLYGDVRRYLNIGRKWYVHRPGLYRGPARLGIKPDGRPDYNKTSTDELLDVMGNLVSTATLIPNHQDLATLNQYVAAGWPMVYHLGYLSLKDRLDRAVWWKGFWEKATGGDPNKHPTSIEEMAVKETKEHGLPLWPPVEA